LVSDRDHLGEWRSPDHHGLNEASDGLHLIPEVLSNNAWRESLAQPFEFPRVILTLYVSAVLP
jgi:hypothetical protein